MSNGITALASAINLLNLTNSLGAGSPTPTPVPTEGSPNITVGNWRLADVEYIDGGYVRGRAESFNQSWGTVCDDGFTLLNA